MTSVVLSKSISSSSLISLPAKSYISRIDERILYVMLCCLPPKDLLVSCQRTCREWKDHIKIIIERYPSPFILGTIQRIRTVIQISVDNEIIRQSVNDRNALRSPALISISKMFGAIPEKLIALQQKLQKCGLKPIDHDQIRQELVDILSDEPTSIKKLIYTRSLSTSLERVLCNKKCIVLPPELFQKGWQFLSPELLIKYFDKLIQRVCDFQAVTLDEQNKKDWFLYDIATSCLQYPLSLVFFTRAKQAIKNQDIRTFAHVNFLIFSSDLSQAWEYAHSIHEAEIKASAIHAVAHVGFNQALQNKDYLHALFLIPYQLVNRIGDIILDIFTHFDQQWALRFIELNIRDPHHRRAAIKILIAYVYRNNLPETAVHLASQFAALKDRQDALVTIIRKLTEKIPETEDNLVLAEQLTQQLSTNKQQWAYECLFYSRLSLQDIEKAEDFLLLINNRAIKERLRIKLDQRRAYIQRILDPIRKYLERGEFFEPFQHLQQEKELSIKRLIVKLIFEAFILKVGHHNIGKLFSPSFAAVDDETLQFMREEFIRFILPNIGLANTQELISRIIPPTRRSEAKVLIVDCLTSVNLEYPDMTKHAVKIALELPEDDVRQQRMFTWIIRSSIRMKDWEMVTKLLPRITNTNLLDASERKAIKQMCPEKPDGKEEKKS